MGGILEIVGGTPFVGVTGLRGALGMMDRKTWTRRSTGRILTLAGVAGMSTSTFLASADIALAHTNLEKADPPAGPVATLPDPLVLRFSGSLDRGSGARLHDVHGIPVDGATGDYDPADRTRIVLTVPPVAPGLYTVAWVAVSAEDGHELLGFYGLVVGGALPLSSDTAPVIATMPADLSVQLAPVTDAVGVTQWSVVTTGATSDAVARVILSFVPPVSGMGTVQVTCKADAVTGIPGASFPMTMAGDWQVEAIIRRTGVSDDARVRFAWTAVLPLGS